MSETEIIGELSERELRELVPRLQELTDKYKRSERIQKALYHISELSSSLDNFDKLYEETHKIVASFMLADNFYIAFLDEQHSKIQFDYFVDERDELTMKTLPYDKIKNGITAHILNSGNTLVMTKENFLQLEVTHGFEVLGTPPVDLMGVPLMRDSKVIGAMVVQSYNDDIRYDADDLEILIFISQHIVTARDRVIQRDLTESIIQARTKELRLTNHQLEDEINERKRVEQLQKALFEISELSVGADDGNILDFYAKLHHILKQLIYAEHCYIAMLDESEDTLQFPYFVGREEDFHSTRKMTRGLTEFVIRSNKSVLVDSNKIAELIESEEVEEKFVIRMIEEKNSWMGAPLSVDNEVKGVIALQTYGQGDDYDDNDLGLLTFVSQHISVAIERREAAEELIKYNQQLSKRVEERTIELNETNESLQKQIDQRKEVELKLIHDAHHDGLTNLPNRVMFNNRLELAIASKSRYQEHNFALLFIDLDRFKTINDTLGHHAGDEFLIEASKRIEKCKRSHDLLARLGGDEFVVLIDKFNLMSDVEAIAQRIVDSISAPFTIEDKEVFSGASIGVAQITGEYKNSDDVLRDADAAMYQAKNLGRNRYVIFDISMRNQLLEELDDERAFRKAFEAGEFEFYIQAISDLSDNSPLYFECSVDWPEHPKGGKRQSFWELADKTGLTYAINKALMEESFRLIEKWRLSSEHKHLKVGFSLSVEHILHKSSFDELVEQIEKNDMYSESLIIQLSEKALSRFNKYLPSILSKLQSLGVHLVLDDFGSHSASLNYLFKYDFDYIRLNQNLVNSFGMSDKYHRLVRAIILVANEMGIAVIANGVNDDMIMQEIVEIGCHFGQGRTIELPQKL